VVFIGLSSDCVGLSCREGVKTRFKQSSVKWTKEARIEIPEWEGREGSSSNFSVTSVAATAWPSGKLAGREVRFHS